MKIIFKSPYYGREITLEVESVQYELDENNVPIDIIAMMSEDVYDSLEDYGIMPGNANRIEPYSDDWLMLYSRGKATDKMTVEKQTVYYEVIFARLPQFQVYNPNGKTMHF